MQVLLDAARAIVALFFLFYASWSDYRTREVSNTVWIFFAPLAFVLTFVELFLYSYEDSNMLFYAVCFGLTATFAVILFYSGGFGGADAKALMCLALALPFYPENLLTPLGDISPISKMFFPITVFSNSVLLAAATAVYMFLRNIFWHKKSNRKLFEEDLKNETWGRKTLVLLTGYKVSVNKLKEKWHVYPLEDVEENVEDTFKRKLVIIPRDEDRNAIVERLTKAVEAERIQDMIWATPGLPMLIFITAGLITALLFGDVVWFFVRFLLG